MKAILFSLFLFAASVGQAQADACDSLISALESALAAPGSTPLSTQQLQQLLEQGRAAKQSGNISACEAAMRSPAPATEGKCEKTPDTV